MDSNILMIYNRHYLIMKSVSKVIDTYLKYSSKFYLNEEISKYREDAPKAILIDQTVFENNISEKLLSIKNQFPGKEIIVISNERNKRIEDQLSKHSIGSRINLWEEDAFPVKQLMEYIN